MSSSPPLRNVFSEVEQLLQTETEARVGARVQTAERLQAEHLNQSVRRLLQASDFAEIAAILCDASTPFCNDCAVLHVDRNRVTGERRSGSSFHDSVFREVSFAVSEAAAFASVIESHEPVVAICSASEISPGLLELFGHPPDEKVHLFPLTVKATTSGILYAAGDVRSAALELLSHCTSLVLEMHQKPSQSATSPLLQIVPAPQAVPKPASRFASPEWDSLSSADRSLHLQAQRFARVQVAGMRLYRSDAVKAGRASHDLYSELREPIDNARQTYRQAFLSATPTMADYLHQELLGTLANDNAGWLGEAYPGPLL